MRKQLVSTNFGGAVALVTGASAGIGEAIARQLTVDHGMKVSISSMLCAQIFCMNIILAAFSTFV